MNCLKRSQQCCTGCFNKKRTKDVALMDSIVHLRGNRISIESFPSVFNNKITETGYLPSDPIGLQSKTINQDHGMQSNQTFHREDSKKRSICKTTIVDKKDFNFEPNAELQSNQCLLIPLEKGENVSSKQYLQPSVITAGFTDRSTASGAQICRSLTEKVEIAHAYIVKNELSAGSIVSSSSEGALICTELVKPVIKSVKSSKFTDTHKEPPSIPPRKYELT